MYSNTPDPKNSYFPEFHVFPKIRKEGYLWMFLTYFLFEVNQILLQLLRPQLILFIVIYNTYRCVECHIHNQIESFNKYSPFFWISRFPKNQKRRLSLNVSHIFSIWGKPNFIAVIEALIDPLYCDIWHILMCRVSDSQSDWIIQQI